MAKTADARVAELIKLMADHGLTKLKVGDIEIERDVRQMPTMFVPHKPNRWVGDPPEQEQARAYLDERPMPQAKQKSIDEMIDEDPDFAAFELGVMPGDKN